MGILISFILPVILFAISLLLKGTLFSLKRTLKILEKKSVDKFDKLDKWSNEDSETSELTGVKHVSSSTIKKTSRIAVRSAKATIKVLRYTISVIQSIVMLIRTVVLFLISLGTIGVVILIALAVALVSCIVVAIIGATTSTGERPNSSVIGGMSGSDYFSINWSQDFTSKLNEISNPTDRNWAEWVILNMRTIQEENLEFAKANPVTYIGMKINESGTKFFKDTKNFTSIFNNYTTVSIEDDATKCAGAMQMWSNAAWKKFNPKYTPNGSSPREPRDSKSGSRFFLPDCSLGTLSIFNDSAEKALKNKSTQQFFGNPRGDTEEMFEEMGVEFTEDRYKQVLGLMFANAYNRGNYNASKTKAPEYRALGYLFIGFMDTYVWSKGSNSFMSDDCRALIESMMQGSSDKPYDSITPKRLEFAIFSSAWGKGDFMRYLDTGDWGVLDKNGKRVNKTLYNSILDNYPSNIRKYVETEIPAYKRRKPSSTVAQFCYALTAHFAGAHSLEKTIDALGLRGSMVSSTENPADGTPNTNGNSEYTNKVLTVVDKYLKDDSSNHPIYRSPPIWSSTNQLKTDCSAFVTGVLAEAGVDAKGKQVSGYNLLKSGKAPSGYMNTSAMVSYYVHGDGNRALVYKNPSGLTSAEIEKYAEAGDILLKNGHVVFYWGKNSKGELVKAHASTNKSKNCSADPENLGNKKYGVGYGKLGSKTDLVYIIRPSLLH